MTLPELATHCAQTPTRALVIVATLDRQRHALACFPKAVLRGMSCATLPNGSTVRVVNTARPDPYALRGRRFDVALVLAHPGAAMMGEIKASVARWFVDPMGVA